MNKYLNIIKMKKITLLIVVLALPIFLFSQETEKPKFGINFSGFVRNDVIFNSRQVVAARGENDFVLIPDPIILDADNNDINDVPNYNIIGFTTRLRGKIAGPDAFGAKTSGLIEMDFLGSTGLSKFDVRLRHAFVKLDWEKNQLLIGQYWHPMFVTDCFPKTVSFGAGITFNPFARNPQVKYTRKFSDKLNLSAAILSQGQYRSKGDHFSQQNSGVPELNIHLQYKTDLFTLGAQFDYQTLKPRIVTDSNFVTNATISSVSYLAYFKLNLKPITIKLYGIYGQGNDNMVMMGGYAITNKTYTPDQVSKNIVEYTAYNTMSYWIDLETTGKKVKFGIFAGISKNLGAKDSVITSSYVGRWGNVNSLMRVSPRLVFISNKVKVAFEIEYSTADYAEQEVDANGNAVAGSNIGGISEFGNVTNFNTANNIKGILSVMYSF